MVQPNAPSSWPLPKTSVTDVEVKCDTDARLTGLKILSLLKPLNAERPRKVLLNAFAEEKPGFLRMTSRGSRNSTDVSLLVGLLRRPNARGLFGCVSKSYCITRTKLHAG